MQVINNSLGYQQTFVLFSKPKSHLLISALIELISCYIMNDAEAGKKRIDKSRVKGKWMTQAAAECCMGMDGCSKRKQSRDKGGIRLVAK